MTESTSYGPVDRERKKREADFHDLRYIDDQRTRVTTIYNDVDFKDAYARLAIQRGAGRRVLELGCGADGLAAKLETVGAQVIPIDISLEAARLTRERHRERSFAVHPVVADAEQVPFADAAFDLVIGSGIVHHLETQRLWSEVRRVLTAGGEAVFLEPLGTNPLVNLFRAVTPKLRTIDEHPLTKADLSDASATTGMSVDVQFFYIAQLAGSAFTLATRQSPWRGLRRTLSLADAVLTRPQSPLRWLSWMAVIHLTKNSSTHLPVAG